jgi:hypothetical protein
MELELEVELELELEPAADMLGFFCFSKNPLVSVGITK